MEFTLRIVFTLLVGFFGNFITSDGEKYKSKLVNMTKTKMTDMINCINEEEDPDVCKQVIDCDDDIPESVKELFAECAKKFPGEGFKYCKKDHKAYSSPDIPGKIFDCVAKKRDEKGEEKLDEEDSKEMVEYEDCVEKIFNNTCTDPKYLNDPKADDDNDDGGDDDNGNDDGGDDGDNGDDGGDGGE